MASSGRRSTEPPPTEVFGDSDFVVVANRLPVDQERLPDGTTTWKRSPAGWSPRSSRYYGAGAGPGSAGPVLPKPMSTR
ncbi:hypothetical protein [Mycobacterium kansasii]|uniref:hypothetical protein n=1 Tax=Mycobacterium kansasii TaxID=1768 RepID=UPI0026D3816A|nr:hypothetical protein [Mycobacterium kansasii]